MSLGLARLGGAEDRRGWTSLALVAGSLGTLLALLPLLPHIAPTAMEGFATAFFPPGFGARTRTVLLSRVLEDAATGGAIALAVAAVAGLARFGRVRHATLLVVALVGSDLLRAGAGLNPMVTGTFFEPSTELAASLGSYRGWQPRVLLSVRRERTLPPARLAKGTGHEMWTFAVALETLTRP